MAGGGTVIIIGIDPGPTTSGRVVVNASAWPPIVISASLACEPAELLRGCDGAGAVICEWLTSYGSAVGASTLDTARLVGRVEERAALGGVPLHLLTRPDVCLALTGTRSAKKAQVREATRQIYRDGGLAVGGGADPCRGVRAQPGPLYLLRDHSWDALAVVLAWLRKRGA